MIDLGYGARELQSLLNPLIARELASIAAIDSATAHEEGPDYVVLMHSAKMGKQANVEQMNTMIRVAGGKPATKAALLKQMLRAQTRTAEMIGTTPALRAMRLAQTELMKRYEQTFGKTEGLVQKAMDRCRHRAIQQWVILTAHVAKRGGIELEERIHLPMPLESYFAGDEARACMRCHFDRPGRHPALERGDPHPYTYICSACHDEVLGGFAPDLAEQSGKWTGHDYESRIIEKALGRPSKLKAEMGAIAKWSGLAPSFPPPPRPRDPASFAIMDLPGEDVRDIELSIPPAEAAGERLYTELLFDFESVRKNW